MSVAIPEKFLSAYCVNVRYPSLVAATQRTPRRASPSSVEDGGCSWETVPVCILNECAAVALLNAPMHSILRLIPSVDVLMARMNLVAAGFSIEW